VELTGNKYAGGGWRKLLATRRGTVLVATVCAVVAAAIIIIAMNSYRHNVNAENSPETVFVASGLIQKGTSGEAIASGQLFKATSIATKQVSTGAIADAAQLHGKVATANIYPGQQLTASDFTASGGLPSELGPSQRAMTVTVDSAHGMVGQINNGDHVDVYADLESGSGKAQQFVRLLLTDVPVLKTPTSANNGTFGNNPSTQQSNVTLKVDSDQAGALAFASDNGKVWLVLRPANAAPSPSGSTVSVQSLASGSSTAAPAGSGR
jgi:Flp pilus assembly protein CpaB